MKKIFCFIILSLVLISQVFSDEKDYSIPRKVQYSFTLQNTGGQVVENVELLVYAPVKRTSTQKVEKIKTSYAHELITDDLENQILRFQFDKITPYASKIVTVEGFLLLSEKPSKTKCKDEKQYLQPEKYIEMNNSEILSLAENLKQKTKLKTVESIYKWVSENIKDKGYTKNDRGALFAFKNKKGDCTEHMYLFIALCRANGIPARGIGGYICKKDKILKPAEFHNWAEFYLEGMWQLADPHGKVFRDRQWEYIATKVFGASEKNPISNYHRFKFSGKGLKVKMNK